MLYAGDALALPKTGLDVNMMAMLCVDTWSHRAAAVPYDTCGVRGPAFYVPYVPEPRRAARPGLCVHL